MADPNDVEDDDDEVTLPEDEVEGQDAGQLDDESGDEAEAGQEPEIAQAEERVGRRERRIQALRKEAQEASERASRFERELSEERARYRQQPQVQQGESAQDEAARLALMTTEERIEYRLRKAEDRHRLEMNITRFQAADMADRAAYESKAQFDPRYKKYKGEVEELLAQERRAGRDFPRETVLYFVLGRKVAQHEGKGKQQQRGQENVRRQQAKADSGRSDVSNTRSRTGSGNSLADLERRLNGVYI